MKNPIWLAEAAGIPSSWDCNRFIGHGTDIATGLMSNSVDDWANGNAVVCNGIPGLTKEQRDLCYANPDVTVAALKGIQMAISECQHQFAWHRWNCSTLTPSSRTQKNSIMLQR
ncbi:hypothetical protein PV326_006270, partial [Microctonus aethiopoides]